MPLILNASNLNQLNSIFLHFCKTVNYCLDKTKAFNSCAFRFSRKGFYRKYYRRHEWNIWVAQFINVIFIFLLLFQAPNVERAIIIWNCPSSCTPVILSFLPGKFQQTWYLSPHHVFFSHVFFHDRLGYVKKC